MFSHFLKDKSRVKKSEGKLKFPEIQLRICITNSHIFCALGIISLRTKSPQPSFPFNPFKDNMYIFRLRSYYYILWPLCPLFEVVWFSSTINSTKVEQLTSVRKNLVVEDADQADMGNVRIRLTNTYVLMTLITMDIDILKWSYAL